MHRHPILLADGLLPGAAIAAPLPAARATATTSTQIVPLPNTIDDACNGDVIAFTGYAHLASHGTIDATGGIHGSLNHALPSQSRPPRAKRGSR